MTLVSKKNRAGKPVAPRARLEIHVDPVVLRSARRIAKEAGFVSANAWAAALVTRASRTGGAT